MTKKIRYGKLLGTGIVWIPLYLVVMTFVYESFFGFNPVLISDWTNWHNAFVHGDIRINTQSEAALFIGMCLFFPLMFVGWGLVYNIHWGKIVKKFIREKKIEPKTIKISGKKLFVPNKLRVQTSAILGVSPDAPPLGQPVSQPSMEDLYSEPIPDLSQDQEGYSDDIDVQQMMTLVSDIPADFFPHIQLDGNYASFAMSTEERALIVRIINRPNSTWAVDIDVPITESDWFYESGVEKSPLAEPCLIAKNLQENEPNSVAVPVILLMSGTLLNPEETYEFFEKNNMMLLRMPEADAGDIPLFLDFAREYFTAGGDDDIDRKEVTNENTDYNELGTES